MVISRRGGDSARIALAQPRLRCAPVSSPGAENRHAPRPVTPPRTASSHFPRRVPDRCRRRAAQRSKLFLAATASKICFPSSRPVRRFGVRDVESTLHSGGGGLLVSCVRASTRLDAAPQILGHVPVRFPLRRPVSSVRRRTTCGDRDCLLNGVSGLTRRMWVWRERYRDDDT